MTSSFATTLHAQLVHAHGVVARTFGNLNRPYPVLDELTILSGACLIEEGPPHEQPTYDSPEIALTIIDTFASAHDRLHLYQRCQDHADL